MSRALIVFAKPPLEGHVKTRLMTELTGPEAVEVYQAFLKDSLVQYSTLGVDVRLYLSGGEIEPSLLQRLRYTSLHRQSGFGLGERMKAAFLETFAAGVRQAVIIGTDHPSLPDEFIRQAFDALAESMSMVIGPSEDGGYYLLGMNHFFPDPFERMTYSHGRVFDETMDRITATAASITVLPAWYDVDTPDMLVHLLYDLRNSRHRAAGTRRVLEKLSQSYEWLRTPAIDEQ